MEDSKIELYREQLSETSILLDDACTAKSYMAVEKLLKRKHDLQDKINDLEEIIGKRKKEVSRSLKDEVTDLLAMIEKAPIQIVKQVNMACESRLAA